MQTSCYLCLSERLKKKTGITSLCRPMLKHQHSQCSVQLGQWPELVSDSANSHEKNGAVETESCTHNVKVGLCMQDFFQMNPCSATSHPSHPRTHKHYLLSSFSASTTMFFLACIHKEENITKEKSRMDYSSERDLMTSTLAFSLLFLNFIFQFHYSILLGDILDFVWYK